MERYAMALVLVSICTLVAFGCVDDFDDVLLEEPGVLQEESTYWVGDVMVNQRETIVRSYDWVTHHYRGSVKNFGTSSLENARFDILTADERNDVEGNLYYVDEEIGNTQHFGTLAPQQELAINLAYAYPSVAHRGISGRCISDSVD